MMNVMINNTLAEALEPFAKYAEAILKRRDGAEVEPVPDDRLVFGIDGYHVTIGDLRRAAALRASTDVAENSEDAAVLAFAKARSWHHFGVAWNKLESVSRNELVKQTAAFMTALAEPIDDSEANTKPFDVSGTPEGSHQEVDHWMLAQSVEPVGLREAAQEAVDRAFDHYRARNGRMCSIEGDDGEKCWIIPHDAMEDLRAALATLTRADEGEG